MELAVQDLDVREEYDMREVHSVGREVEEHGCSNVVALQGASGPKHGRCLRRATIWTCLATIAAADGTQTEGCLPPYYNLGKLLKVYSSVSR